MRKALLATVSLVAGTFALVGCKGSEPVAPKNGTVAITADGTGFSPSSVEAKRGEKLELVFTRTSDDTCATEVVFPELSIKKDLPLKTAVSIDVPTGEARTLTFQCGMGMYKSKVLVK